MYCTTVRYRSSFQVRIRVVGIGTPAGGSGHLAGAGTEAEEGNAVARSGSGSDHVPDLEVDQTRPAAARHGLLIMSTTAATTHFD